MSESRSRDEIGDEEIHHGNDKDVGIQGGRLGRGGSGVSLGAPQPLSDMARMSSRLPSRLELVPDQETPSPSDRITDQKMNPELKQLELAPDQEAPHRPSLAAKDVQPGHGLHDAGTRISSLNQTRVGAFHSGRQSGQGPIGERSNNESNDEQDLAIAAVVVEEENHPQAAIVVDDKKRRTRLWVVLLVVAVVAITLSIAIPLSIRAQNKSIELVTLAPVTSVPTTSTLPTTEASLAPTLSSEPSTSLAPTRKVTAEELRALILSRLPSVSFSSASSAEYQALEWMTEIDGNTEILSDDRLVQRFAMASIGFSISQLENWFSPAPECSWGTSQLAIICNNSSQVTSAILDDSETTGKLPPTIGLLSQLTRWPAPSLRRLGCCLNLRA